MWRLHRYFLKETVITAGITFILMLGIVFLGVLPRLIHRTQGASLWVTLAVAGMWCLDYVPDLIWVSLLIAIAFTYARASAENEIQAVRASGIHVSTLYTPALLLGLSASVLISLLVHAWIPYIHFKKYEAMAGLAQQFLNTLSSSNGQLKLKNVEFAFDPARYRGGNVIENVTFHVERGDVRWFGQAREVMLVTDLEAGILRLTVRNPQGREERKGSTHDITLGEINFEVSLRDVLGGKEHEVGDRDIRTSQIVAELVREDHARQENAYYVIFNRMVHALAPLVMSAIAFAVGILVRRGGALAALALAFLPLAGFYVFEIVAKRLVQRTEIPELAFLPIAALTVFGLPPFVKVMRS